MIRVTASIILGSAVLLGQAQLVIWAEEFENGCSTGCYASAYNGVNGAWTVTSTGTNGACPNRWFVSCAENGNPAGTCGSGCGNNETLHIANSLPATCGSPNACAFCPGGDCGAAYDAGCPAAFCGFCTLVCGNCNSTAADRRADSPVIDLTGQNNVTLSFKYMEGGQGVTDNATVWFFEGTVWALLADMPKTPVVGACGGQGQWTNYSVALPATANNNPNVRIGFRWVNDNDGSGSDPSVAIDDVQLSVLYDPPGTGLIVNELSNGPSGNKEYIELLVVGDPCTTVDIRGVIVDDNNGSTHNGFGTTMTGSGVSQGHIRFSNAAQWAVVPTGSLIVIHNSTDPNVLVPADDPADTAPQDSIYILPANHALLQGCNTAPNATLTGGYAPCVYGAGNWNSIAFRNEGDAGQTRDAQGRYFHGISYGSNANNMNTGGLDALRISTVSHVGRVLFFNAGDYRVAGNFTSALVAGNETPGVPNNTANEIYRQTLLCATLPVELLSFEVRNDGPAALLEWTTASEMNSGWFHVQRSSDGELWHTVLSRPAAGQSMLPVEYRAHDPAPIPGLSYYRLRQVDLDGRAQMGPVRSLMRTSGLEITATTLNDGAILLKHPCTNGTWRIADLLGRTVAESALGESPALLHPPAWSAPRILTVRCGEQATSLRLPPPY